MLVRIVANGVFQIRHVSPSVYVRIYQFASHCGTNFREILYRRRLLKSIMKTQILLQLDKNFGHFT
jgi:hypothetical protein